MMMEVEVDMERVLDRLNLLLDGAGGDHPCSRGGGGGSPGKDAGGGLKERIARALRLYKETAADGTGGALVQVWAPARDGDRRVLATRGQPFVLSSQCHRLFQYRAVSLTHVFAVGGGDRTWEERGLPGRVFDAGAPEWTPNVQFYSSAEYARMSYALIYDIQGSLGMPILDPDTGRCLAVLELVMTAPRVRFAGEVDKLCSALQAVALRGSEICRSMVEVCNSEATQPAMPKVSDLLAAVCEAHNLPLAQAWVRCKRCSQTNSTDEQFSLTTAGAPFHLAGGADTGFREACVEHHLRSGQGFLGAAAATRRPRFCADVARCSKDANPLAHYARMHGMAACLVVPLQLQLPPSGASAMEEELVVLEFFLSPDCRSAVEQKAAVDAIAAMIREECSRSDHLKATVMIDNLQDLSLDAVLADDDQEPDLVVADDGHELNDHGDYGCKNLSMEDVHLEADAADVEAVNIHGADQNGGEDNPRLRPGKKKMRRGKAGNSVGLEVLQRYFSGSLKDAARSLGVCPTTMKRICRQHGISRWPFRKISKVNRSLAMIKHDAMKSAPKPITGPSSQPAQAPPPPPPPPLPCPSTSIALEDTSSQGSCQEPPPTRIALRKSLLQGSNGPAGGAVTIKASYKGDIVRFRVPSSAGVAQVKEEVAKRLGLTAGNLDIKYLDDDHEWVNLSCDADFQECLEVVPTLPSSSSTAQVVRMMVQEVADNIGSSCGSSE